MEYRRAVYQDIPSLPIVVWDIVASYDTLPVPLADDWIMQFKEAIVVEALQVIETYIVPQLQQALRNNVARQQRFIRMNDYLPLSDYVIEAVLHLLREAGWTVTMSTMSAGVKFVIQLPGTLFTT